MKRKDILIVAVLAIVQTVGLYFAVGSVLAVRENRCIYGFSGCAAVSMEVK